MVVIGDLGLVNLRANRHRMALAYVGSLRVMENLGWWPKIVA